MKTEKEIISQLAIGKALHTKGKWDKDLPEDYPDRLKVLEEKHEVVGYVDALLYVLGFGNPKWSKEDLK